jgi:hypothetical protein
MGYTKEQYSDKRYVWHMAEAKEWVPSTHYHGHGPFSYEGDTDGSGYSYTDGASHGYFAGQGNGWGYLYAADGLMGGAAFGNGALYEY